jgi:hypothetical protein
VSSELRVQLHWPDPRSDELPAIVPPSGARRRGRRQPTPKALPPAIPVRSEVHGEVREDALPALRESVLAPLEQATAEVRHLNEVLRRTLDERSKRQAELEAEVGEVAREVKRLRRKMPVRDAAPKPDVDAVVEAVRSAVERRPGG